MLRMKSVIVAALCVLCQASSVSAQSRTLRWSHLAVTAHLDNEGRLHVQERHSIVFDGEWNGGERTFRQSLETVIQLERVSRVDESGNPIPMHEDKSLARVDDYGWANSNTLRWRSRLPSDPPFEHREITYLLEYTAANILIPGADSYLLDHNFGLPDLEWPIDEYSVDLTLDPVWQPLEAIPQHITRSHRPHGENVTVASHLRHTGSTPPAAVNHGASAWLRYALLALLLAAPLWTGLQFRRRERAIGRLDPLPDSAVDRAWLETHILKFPPEVVGAAWDDRTDAAEVAAVIARLVQEGKLSSRVEKSGRKDELVLTLLRPKDSFDGYEASLVKALFFDGDTTSTERIKAHYKSQGFDPVSKIRAPLDRKAGELAGRNGAPKVARSPTVTLALAGGLLLGLGCLTGALNIIGALVSGCIVLLGYVGGFVGAVDYRRRLSRLAFFTVEFIPAILVIVVAPALLLMRVGGLRFNGAMLGGIVLLSIAAVRSIFNLAMSRDAGECLQHRRRLAAARNYFARELRRPQPALDDSWFPYVLAFGLGADADRWFRSFGGTSAAATPAGTLGSPSPSSHSSSTTGGSGSRGWTGAAGGASGGAGASGTWAVAATAMAAGVASPSSAGSGGGGGGGSSGGGGGGGW
jgi:hypothetical protein